MGLRGTVREENELVEKAKLPIEMKFRLPLKVSKGSKDIDTRRERGKAIPSSLDIIKVKLSSCHKSFPILVSS